MKKYPKNYQIFDRFLVVFASIWGGFGTPKSVPDRPKIETNREKKGVRKHDAIFDRFLIDLGPIFGGFGEGFGDQHSTQNR